MFTSQLFHFAICIFLRVAYILRFNHYAPKGTGLHDQNGGRFPALLLLIIRHNESATLVALVAVQKEVPSQNADRP